MCLLPPATTWPWATPHLVMPTYTFGHCGWFTLAACLVVPFTAQCMLFNLWPGNEKINLFLSVNMTLFQHVALLAWAKASFFFLVSRPSRLAGLPLKAAKGWPRQMPSALIALNTVDLLVGLPYGQALTLKAPSHAFQAIMVPLLYKFVGPRLGLS